MKENSCNDYEAMILWNKVLTDDKSNVTTAFAYISRAYLFHSKKLYQSALNNIALAEANGIAASFVDVLKKQCLIHMKYENVPIDNSKFLKINHPVNDRIPWMANCLKLRRDAALKPYIITDRQLNIGDVICKEKALFGFSYDRDHQFESVEVDVAHQRCYHCFNHNNLDLVPCSGCDSGEFTS